MGIYMYHCVCKIICPDKGVSASVDNLCLIMFNSVQELFPDNIKNYNQETRTMYITIGY